MRNTLLLIALAAYLQYAATEFVVQTEQGKVAGYVSLTRKGREFLVYENIPFAEPPVGDLRFRDPVPKKRWDGVLDGTHGNQCVQTADDNAVVGDEDCLYLNVYTPRDCHSKKSTSRPLLPVMVFIHGGGFDKENGSRSAYGPELLLDKNVILVAMNYRLGVFGFISAGNSELPGNFGLKDQRLAMEWVQRNIRQFGGDKNRVTLFGESAGASSVGLHILSDKSKDLFHQYITQSGTPINSWVLRKKPSYYEIPRRIAEEHNCSTESPGLIVKCLRELTAEQLVLSLNNPTAPQLVDRVPRWTPTVEPKSENAFLTEAPITLIKQRKVKNCPFITGTVKDEGLLAAAGLYISDEIYQEYVNDLNQAIMGILFVNEWEERDNLPGLIEKIKQFYFGRDVLNSKEKFQESFTNFAGDFLFHYPQKVFLDYMQGIIREQIFFYNLNYRGSKSFTMAVKADNKTYGVSHADDLIYLLYQNNNRFNLPPDVKSTPNDEKITDIMVDLWTSFATTRTPISTHMQNPRLWRPYSPNKNALLIGRGFEPSISLGHTYYPDRMNFWSQNLPE